MFRHILSPTDGSKLSSKGVKAAIKLAGALDAKLTVIHVVNNFRSDLQDEGFAVPNIPALRKRFEDAASARAKRLLDPVKAAAKKAGVECDVVVATGNLPYEVIINQAGKLRCDVIVMASHGYRGLKGILIGSETVKVLTHSKLPVLVVR